jgi:hypothetical protein
MDRELADLNRKAEEATRKIKRRGYLWAIMSSLGEFKRWKIFSTTEPGENGLETVHLRAPHTNEGKTELVRLHEQLRANQKGTQPPEEADGEVSYKLSYSHFSDSEFRVALPELT